MSHRCPGPDCTRTVPDEMLACAPHWYRVTSVTRARVWVTYRSDPGGEAHRAAVAQAIEEMNR